jgi:hypothetical protein
MRFHVVFHPGGSRESDFEGDGYVYLYDTCLVMAGGLLRFRIPLIGGALEKFLRVETFRTVPYAVIQRYTRPGPLRQGRNLLSYRLPSGKVVKVAFTVAKDSGGRKSGLEDRLEEFIASTKAFFVR